LSIEIPAFYWYPSYVNKDLEENLYIVGERIKPLIGNETEMFCLKISSNGVMSFYNGYSPGNHSTAVAQYIEPMVGGKMRMSGNKGKSVVAYELNTDGTVAGYKEYMNNPLGFVQLAGAYVQQSDSGHYLVSVRTWSGGAIPNTAIIKFDSSLNKQWSCRKSGFYDFPFPTLDGGFVALRFSTEFYQIFMERVGNDTSTIWSLDINQKSAIPGRRGGKFYYLGNNDGIMYGGAIVNGRQISYLSKVGNVGLLVDPTNPIPPVRGTQKIVTKTEIGYAFPNPSTGIFHVLGMGSGLFRMVDEQGKIVMEENHKGGDEINVSGLPCGVYTYTLVTNQSKTQGRVVRN